MKLIAFSEQKRLKIERKIEENKSIDILHLKIYIEIFKNTDKQYA